ncbi:MAG: formylglycine-generating enzyme family protein [Thainema sp.]
MKRRRFFQYAGLGSIGFLLASRDRAFGSSLTQAEYQPDLSLRTFRFDVATVDKAGRIKQRSTHTAQFFSAPIGQTESSEFIDMVAIAPGQFWMGASKTEADAKGHEFPRHRVNLSPFLISKYPITQAQWTAVAALPKVQRELDPVPSYFQGDHYPVESVSWLDAMEFCDRISQYTGRRYQLPSEAQWEYACRSGTRTPFNTGETITSELANYVGAYTYRAEQKASYPQSTLPVGQYSPNAFGLYDMHGNVWEWCADTWHANYRGAPRDGTAWVSAKPSQLRTIRGGGWLDAPATIRSASRSGYLETALNRTIGFRVVTV